MPNGNSEENGCIFNLFSLFRVNFFISLNPFVKIVFEVENFC